MFEKSKDESVAIKILHEILELEESEFELAFNKGFDEVRGEAHSEQNLNSIIRVLTVRGYELNDVQRKNIPLKKRLGLLGDFLGRFLAFVEFVLTKPYMGQILQAKPVTYGDITNRVKDFKSGVNKIFGTEINLTPIRNRIGSIAEKIEDERVKRLVSNILQELS